MATDMPGIPMTSTDVLIPDESWTEIDRFSREDTRVARAAGGYGLARQAACPVCDKTDLVRFTIKREMNIDECSACGFRFTNPYPSNEQLAAFYNGKTKILENELFYKTRSFRAKIFEARVDFIQKWTTSGRLLDVGGATGIFADALLAAKLDFDISVLDLSEDACEHLRQCHPTLTVICSDIRYHHAVYDVVTSWDTIEHIPNPLETAAHLAQLLKPGGMLFLSTPNIAGFEHRVGGANHPQVEPISHLNYFSTDTLAYLLERVGLAVVSTQTPNGHFDLAYVRRLLSEGTANTDVLGQFLMEQLDNPAFSNGFAALLAQTKLAGNVVIAARKPA